MWWKKCDPTVAITYSQTGTFRMRFIFYTITGKEIYRLSNKLNLSKYYEEFFTKVEVEKNNILHFLIYIY